MAIVKPFRAIRPSPDKVHLVASRPVDTYKPEELNSKLADNPYTFLHIIKPDFGKKAKSAPGSKDLLYRIKDKFNEFQNDKILIQDEQPGYYIYTQEKKGRTYTGIIGCASIDDYLNGVIKIHEQTLTNKEDLLKDYLEICDFNAEPVCMTYPSDAIIEVITKKIITTDPIYDFTTTNRRRHKLWKVSDADLVKEIEGRFSSLPYIYIADGHHRSSSSTLLGKAKRQQLNKFSGDEPFNFFMAIYFPEDQLDIYDYNRVVKDLNGLSKDEFLDQLLKNFNLEEMGANVYKPQQLHEFALYIDGKWYSLKSKPGTFDEKDPAASLDPAILTKNLLAPVLNIKDLRTDKRIGFVNGVAGPEAIKELVDNGKMRAGFVLFPVTMNQLKAVADAGETMPPKSTWIEPKLRNGLTIYSLSEW
jgi:uncharacterized protein (DUF1015 family)